MPMTLSYADRPLRRWRSMRASPLSWWERRLPVGSAGGPDDAQYRPFASARRPATSKPFAWREAGIEAVVTCSDTDLEFAGHNRADDQTVQDRPHRMVQAARRHQQALGRVRFLDEPLDREEEGEELLSDRYARASSRLWDERWTSAVAGYGTAFGTKLLYWGSRQQRAEVLPLIYDQRVHAALVHLGVGATADAGSSVVWDHPWDCVRLSCYAMYCSWAEDVAAYLNEIVRVTPTFRGDDVEHWLFDLGGTVPKGPRGSGCSNRKRRVDENDRDDPLAGPSTHAGGDVESLLRCLVEQVPVHSS